MGTLPVNSQVIWRFVDASSDELELLDGHFTCEFTGNPIVYELLSFAAWVDRFSLCLKILKRNDVSSYPCEAKHIKKWTGMGQYRLPWPFCNLCKTLSNWILRLLLGQGMTKISEAWLYQFGIRLWIHSQNPSWHDLPWLTTCTCMKDLLSK